VVNGDLNAAGLELMRGLDVLDQLGRVECPSLVCVGELDPVTPVAAAREIRRRAP
jgi:pimeloyl-ACP methyl ester carboxylesterase